MLIPVRRLMGLSVLALLGAAALGCNSKPLRRLSTPTVPIASLEQSQNLGQHVRLQGRVAEVVPLASRHVYRLEDDSGEVWVLDTQAGESPAVGASLSLEVRVAAAQIQTGNGMATEIYVRRQQQL